MEEENYYDLLEINGNASDDEIKKAYRRLALKWHPDKNPFNKHEAEIHFKKVSEAYEILSDREKKDIYDRYGKEGLLNPSQRESYQDFDLFGRSPRVPRFHFRDPNELFNDFFKNNTFDMLNRPLQGIFDFPNSFSRMNGIFSNFGNLSSFSNFNPNLDRNQEFYNPNLDVTSHSSSTKMINGKKYETIKIEERGIETILKKENGVLMSKTINGIPQNIEKIET